MSHPTSPTTLDKVAVTAAVALARFFWPEFIEVRGCILLKDRYAPETFREWEGELHSRADIEAVINHVHLWDVFPRDDAMSEDAMAFLGRVIEATWTAALVAAFS